MPKKTKKQKIIAAYHKKMKLVEKVAPATSISKAVVIESKKVEEKKQEIAQSIPVNSFFFLDMRKSLILIALVIALEIALYFAKLIR